MIPESKSEKMGVCYISRVPPYMNADYIRKEYSKRFKVGRIYLEAEPDYVTRTRKKMGGNRKTNYIEGWIEFERKKDAKLAALALNG